MLILAYELRLAGLPAGAAPRAEAQAEAGAVEDALDDLREALLAVEYLNPASPEKVLAEIRALLLRAGVTPRELSLLRGIARQVRWAAGHIARGAGGKR